MAKFCALLYREWRVSRKAILSGFITTAVFFCMFWLVGLSLLYGNLKRFDTGDPFSVMLKQWLTGYGSVYCLLVCSMFPVFCEHGTHSSDIRTNWLRYSFGLPVTPVMRAAVYWGMTLLVMLGCFLMNVLNLFMFRLIFGQPVRAEAFAVFAFVLTIGLVLNLALTVYPLGARTQSELQKRQIISLAAICLCSAAVIVPMKRTVGQKVAALQEQTDLSDTELVKQTLRVVFIDPLHKLYDACKYYTVPAILLLIALGFFLTVKAYERRETP